MRNKFSFIVLFVLFGYKLSAQTLITGTVSDSLNIPVPNASVYISKTTIGTITDQIGAYSIYIPQEGEFELTASFIGYRTKSVLIVANGIRQIINIRLSINPVLLNEVTVRSKYKYSLKNYTDFCKLFIGEKENARSCKISDAEDLHLYRDPENSYLRGFSVKPLKIENMALGYSITYDLIDFNYNLIDSILRFSGYCYFKPMQGSARNVRKWNRNSLIAYYGSRMHFLRSLYSDSISSNNFKVFECKSDSVKDIISAAEPIDFHALKPAIKSQYLPLYSKTPLLITYTDNHSEISTGILGFQSQEYKSTMTFSDTLEVFKNGNYNNPDAVTWSGAMVNVRVANMLPSDFLPNAVQRKQTDVNKDANKSKIEIKLESQQNKNSEDQIFVQTDRNKYRPGDTIRFQSYIRDRFSGSFESGSSAMYVILYNDQNQVVDSSRFRIINATSPGWLAIPANAKAGIYHFVAFTSMMQNFDPSDAFHLNLMVEMPEIQPLNIEIRMNKEKFQPGDTLEALLKINDNYGNPINQQKYKYSLISDNYLIDSDKSITTKAGESFIRFIIPDSLHYISRMQITLYNNRDEKIQTRNFSVPFLTDSPDLRFFPEGGNLISGLKQVVGFNAVDRLGVPVEIEGLLKNKTGIVLDTIKSGPYGPGKFTCIPDEGMYLELIKGEGDQKIWPLPTTDSSGIALSIKPVDRRSFAIEVQSNNYDGDTVYLSGMMNLQQIFEKKFALNQKQRFVIKTEDLVGGIAVITLFDKNQQPIAERMVAVNIDKRLRISVKTDQRDYTPGQEAELAVTVTDQDGKPSKGIFSISVADSASGYDCGLFLPEIEYSLNYNPFFPHNLPPVVSEKGLQNLTDEQLDLMLMTYGWCKISWDLNPVPKNKELTDYDQLKMKLNYIANKRPAESKLDLISPEGPIVMHLKTNETGEISLPLDSLPENTKSVTLLPGKNCKNKVTGAMLTIPYNEQFLKDRSLFASQQSKDQEMNADIFNINKPVISDKNSEPGLKKHGITDKTFELPGVTISAVKKTEYINKYEEIYKYANVKSLSHEQLSSSNSIVEAIRRLVNPYKMETVDEFHPGAAIYLRPRHSFFGDNIKVLFVLDGMPIHADNAFQRINDLDPKQVASISVLEGDQGHVIYGEEASGGVIFINTYYPGLSKIRTDWKSQNTRNNLLTPINIFRKNVEFYNPSQSEIEDNQSFRERPTAYWNPRIYFDGMNPVRIKYINPVRSSKIIISVNGVSLNNLIGTAKTSYQVHESK